MESIRLVSASIARLRALGVAPNTPEFIPLSLHAEDSQNRYLVELGTWAYPLLTDCLHLVPAPRL